MAEGATNYLSPNSAYNYNDNAATSHTSLATSETSNQNVLTAEEAARKAKNASAFHLFFKQLWIMLRRNAIIQVS